jgi:hypothetical protein
MLCLSCLAHMSSSQSSHTAWDSQGDQLLALLLGVLPVVTMVLSVQRCSKKAQSQHAQEKTQHAGRTRGAMAQIWEEAGSSSGPSSSTAPVVPLGTSVDLLSVLPEAHPKKLPSLPGVPETAPRESA